MDTSRLDLNLLITLEALLTERNVTRAAARLHLSQPAVSAQLSRLRDLFDDPLLIPAARGMTPTAKAESLLAPLRLALDQVRAAVSSQEGFVPSTSDLVLSIACTDYLQSVVVHALVVELRSRAPRMRVALRNLDLAQLDAQMARGDVDLALMTPQAAPPALRGRRLFVEHYVLVGRRGHPGLETPLTVARFARMEHVVVSLQGGQFTTPVDDVLAARGHRRKVMLSAASFLLVPEIVSRTDYVALVPQRLVEHMEDRLEIRACPFPVDGFDVGMVWHERSQGHAGHRWIRELVVTMTGARRGGRAARDS